MLALMQLMKRMVYLEYSNMEIDAAFTDIVNGDETIDTLCDALGVELSPTMRQLAMEKVSKWESAFFVVTGKAV